MSDLYLFRSALKDLFRTKTVVAASVLILLPVILGACWHGGVFPHFQPDTAYNLLATGIVFGFILVLLSVIYATGVISQEVEQKTIVYLLTRPIPRWRILLMKFFAAFAAITITVWLASLLTALAVYGTSGLSGSRLGRDLVILPLGALAYGTLFLLLATLLNRPLIYGLLFAFGWETWVPNMPGSFQKLSLMAYLRVLAPHPQPGQPPMSADALAPLITDGLAWKTLLGVIVVALTAALFFFSTREYVPREDAD